MSIRRARKKRENKEQTWRSYKRRKLNELLSDISDVSQLSSPCRSLVSVWHAQETVNSSMVTTGGNCTERWWRPRRRQLSQWVTGFLGCYWPEVLRVVLWRFIFNPLNAMTVIELRCCGPKPREIYQFNCFRPFCLLSPFHNVTQDFTRRKRTVSDYTSTPRKTDATRPTSIVSVTGSASFYPVSTTYVNDCYFKQIKSQRRVSEFVSLRNHYKVFDKDCFKLK